MFDKKTVNRIREFNRFYTVQQGFLNGRYLQSDFSVTETRILYEIYQKGTCNASYLVDLLQLDKGYVSRIIKGFEKKELVMKETSSEDNRFKDIQLTAKGEKTIQNIVDLTNRAIGLMINGLNDTECHQLCEALDIVTRSLGRKELVNKESVEK